MFWEVSPELRIEEGEFDLSFVRSSGPGGQNVNKVNSKAVLRWNLMGSASVPPVLKARLLGKLRPQLSAEGFLVVTSDRFRDQPRNREDCYAKLRDVLLAALFVAKPRKATRPSRSSVRRVQEGKARVSQKKSMRKKPSWD